MSEYGMIVSNITGRVVIDSQYRNYSYNTSSTLALSSGITNLDITDTAYNIIVGLKPTTTGYSSIVSYSKSGSNFTDIKFASTTSQTIGYCIWREHRTQDPDTGYGLNIYNEDGNLVFSSNETKYMRIVGLYSPGWSSIDTSQNKFSCSVGGASIIMSQGVPGESQFTVVDADNNYFLFIGRQESISFCSGSSKRWHFFPGLKKINSTTLSHSLTGPIEETSVSLGFDGAFQNGIYLSPYYLLEIAG